MSSNINPFDATRDLDQSQLVRYSSGEELWADSEGEGAVSRPSKNNPKDTNKPGNAPVFNKATEEIEDIDLHAAGIHGVAQRPACTQNGEKVREEVTREVPKGVASRSSVAMLRKWRNWMEGYKNQHLTLKNGDGEVYRKKMENSYQQDYADRYYAKLKGLEREIEGQWGEENLTTVMLTLSASNTREGGQYRAICDHMVDIREGWQNVYSRLPEVLSGYEYHYARVWEPHKSGYGHQHVAIFVEDPEGSISASDFRPCMRSYVNNTQPAGKEAHSNTACAEHSGAHGDEWDSADPTCGECDCAISVNHDVQNVGSYVGEYIGMYGEEALKRPLSTQLFYSATWATDTRRIDFNNSAQELISRDLFRQQRGLDPDEHEALFENWRGPSTSKVQGDCEASEGVEQGGDSEPRVKVLPEQEAVLVGGELASEYDEGGGDSEGWHLDSMVTGTRSGPIRSAPPDGGGSDSMVTITAGADEEPASRAGFGGG